MMLATPVKRFLYIAFAASLALPLLASYLLLESSPFIEPMSALTHDDVKRIKGLIKQHNFFYLRRNEIKTIVLTEQDMDLLLNYGLSYAAKENSKVNPNVWAKMQLRDRQASLMTVQSLQFGSWKSYLNFKADFETVNGKWHVQNVKLGKLSIPHWLSIPLAAIAHKWISASKEEYQLIANAVQSIDFRDREISVVYQWHPDVIANLRERGRDWILSEDERNRIRVYFNELALKTHRAGNQAISSQELVRDLFMLARDRTSTGHDAIAENRALILSFAFYLADVDTRRVLGNSRSFPLIHPRKVELKLLKRKDLMQHFFVSAALTVSAGQKIADVIGLAKEMDDSMGGSGFSFADLLADRTGVRFAEIATENEVKARQLQFRMSKDNLAEIEFMPSIDNMPEGLTEEDFIQNYKNVESDVYRRIESEILRRISNLPIYNPDFSA